MARIRRRLPLRAAAFPGALLAALMGTAVLATPVAAHQANPSVPVMGIRSIGDVVATRDTLRVDKVVMEIGFVGTQQITFRFDLDTSQVGAPAGFLADQADPACRTLGTAPAATVECAYTRQITAGKDEEFTFGHRIAPPGPPGRPEVEMTVTVGELSQRRTLVANRVKPESDFVVTTGAPAQGHVGETVEFTWTLTNVGPDAVWDYPGMIKLTAPAGTEFPPLAQITKPEGLGCNDRTASKTNLDCWFVVVKPGAANARRVTWPLKIVSATVGEGRVTATLSNMTGQHPEADYEDPTPADNTAPIRVSVLGTGETGTASPSPGTDGQLPTTGSKTGLIIGIGLAAALGGALLVFATRRRFAA
ncbi:LPXTG cell wall anchor domain-containing protein [Catellatospora methionotrophica]|uniref:LPXTG cell wall anchor domain-containing protein n=1 Tax=Catellatospora methionotrophica TaxID=121620 RepID=UPI0033C7FCCC